MLRLAKRLFRRGGDDMAAPSIDAKAVTPSTMPDTAPEDSSAATTASVCDLLIGNNLLQGYLGGADALRLEVVSKRHPFGRDALRNRTLLRFPSNDEGFSYKRWKSPLVNILHRYPNIRIIDAEISTMDCIGDDNRLFLHVLMIELAGASLPHLRERHRPDARQVEQGARDGAAEQGSVQHGLGAAAEHPRDRTPIQMGSWVAGLPPGGFAGLAVKTGC